MIYLCIYTRPMMRWTGGTPWRFCKVMGWSPGYSDSWPVIVIGSPWEQGQEGITTTPSRDIVVSPWGGGGSLGCSML